jgi:hypothetical protein
MERDGRTTDWQDMVEERTRGKLPFRRHHSGRQFPPAPVTVCAASPSEHRRVTPRGGRRQRRQILIWAAAMYVGLLPISRLR